MSNSEEQLYVIYNEGKKISKEINKEEAEERLATLKKAFYPNAEIKKV